MENPKKQNGNGYREDLTSNKVSKNRLSLTNLSKKNSLNLSPKNAPRSPKLTTNGSPGLNVTSKNVPKNNSKRKICEEKISIATISKPKWPVVEPSHVTTGKPRQDSARLLVDQLNNMRKELDVAEETEGPYNFQCLLRKSNALPTDSLRQRRQGKGERTAIMEMFGGNKKENVEPVISMAEQEFNL